MGRSLQFCPLSSRKTVTLCIGHLVSQFCVQVHREFRFADVSSWAWRPTRTSREYRSICPIHARRRDTHKCWRRVYRILARFHHCRLGITVGRDLQGLFGVYMGFHAVLSNFLNISTVWVYQIYREIFHIWNKCSILGYRITF